jgi:hypothetical protein
MEGDKGKNNGVDQSGSEKVKERNDLQYIEDLKEEIRKNIESRTIMTEPLKNKIENDLTKKKEELRDKIEKIRKQVYKNGLMAILFFGIGFSFLLVGLTNYIESFDSMNRMLFYFYGITFFVSGFGPLVFLMNKLHISRQYEEDKRDINFEIELLKYTNTVQEKRAEKLLRINQYELKRYYDLNLRQNYWIFYLGVICIILGVVVIGVSLYLVTYSSRTWEEKVVMGILGSIGGILTNYVASIYFQMHKAVTQSLTTFYSKLVDNHNLFFANLLISRIENEDKLQEALHDLAISITKQKDTPKIEKKETV